MLFLVRLKEQLSSGNLEDQDETKRTGVVDSSFEGTLKCFDLL